VLVWACNSEGIFYIPGEEATKYFNMRQGEGYKLKLTSRNTLNNFQFTTESTTALLESIPGKSKGKSKDENPQISSLKNSHFQFRKRTQNAYPIVLVDIEIEGITPSDGDEIGVFMWDTLCVGAVEYQGGDKTLITAWEDEIMTPGIIDGYGEGQVMSFKYWDESESEEIDLDLNYTINSASTATNTIFTTAPIFGEKSYARISFSGVSTNIEVPNEFKLHQNYPNPFNPATKIRFDLPEASKVKLEIFNVLGQRVAVLKNQIYSAGYKEVFWDGKSESGLEIVSGLYFYRMDVKGLSTGKRYNQTRKMMLLK
jgi:hypothetical protein